MQSLLLDLGKLPVVDEVIDSGDKRQKVDRKAAKGSKLSVTKKLFGSLYSPKGCR